MKSASVNIQSWPLNQLKRVSATRTAASGNGPSKLHLNMLALHFSRTKLVQKACFCQSEFRNLLRKCSATFQPEQSHKTPAKISLPELSAKNTPIHLLSGPVLRDTARLSQRYPPIARYGVFGVSTWPIGCDTPSPFSEHFPLEEHAKWRCDTPPPTGVSQRYLRDTLLKQGKWMR